MKEAQNILTEQDPPAIYYGQLQWYTILRKDIQGYPRQPALSRLLPLLRDVPQTDGVAAVASGKGSAGVSSTPGRATFRSLGQNAMRARRASSRADWVD